MRVQIQLLHPSNDLEHWLFTLFWADDDDAPVEEEENEGEASSKFLLTHCMISNAVPLFSEQRRRFSATGTEQLQHSDPDMLKHCDAPVRSLSIWRVRFFLIQFWHRQWEAAGWVTIPLQFVLHDPSAASIASWEHVSPTSSLMGFDEQGPKKQAKK